MRNRRMHWTAATIAGLLLGTAVTVPAQQNRQQDQSQRGQTQQSKLQLPGSESVLEIDADVPSETRVGEQVDYPITVRNVSDNVALHDLKLKIQAQEGMTLEQVQLEEKDGGQQQRGQQQLRGQQQQRNQRQRAQQQRRQQREQQNDQDQQRPQDRQQRDQDQQRDNQQQEDQQSQRQNGQQRQGRQQQDQQQRDGQRQQRQRGQQTDSQQQSRQQGNRDQQQGQQSADRSSQSGQQQQSQQSGDQQERAADGSHSVTIGKLMPGESRTINVSATVEQEGEAQACVLVTQFSPALCLKTEAVKPELELVKTAPEKASLCELIEFEYFVKNSGSGDLGTFEISDELPQGLQTESGDKQLKFEVDGLQAGDTRKFVATLRATEGGEYSSRAVAKTSEGETTRSSRVTTTVEEARLAVAIDGPRSTLIDEPATYQIRVTNQGNVRAENAQVVLHHPDIARFRGAGEFRETDNEVAMQSGQSEPTAANQSQQSQQDRQQQNQDGQRQNQNSEQSQKQGSQQQQNQQQQNQDQDPQEEGRQQNNEDQQQAQRQQQQQDQQRQQQADAQDPQSQEQNRSTRRFDLGTMEPGQTKQMTLTLLPTEDEQIRATAVARYRCATSDRDWQQSQASTSTDVIAIPAMLLSVVDDEGDRDDAGEVTYTIVIRNQGTAPDQQIRISASLPEGLEFVEGSGDTDVSAEGQKLNIAPLEELAPEEEARWQIMARAKGDSQQEQVRFRVNLESQALDQKVVAEEPTTILPKSRTSARPSEISN